MTDLAVLVLAVCFPVHLQAINKYKAVSHLFEQTGFKERLEWLSAGKDWRHTEKHTLFSSAAAGLYCIYPQVGDFTWPLDYKAQVMLRLGSSMRSGSVCCGLGAETAVSHGSYCSVCITWTWKSYESRTKVSGRTSLLKTYSFMPWSKFS